MIETWEELDEVIEQGIAEVNRDNGMLRAQLTVLLTKRMVTYQTSIDEIQQLLLKRYNVEYKPSDVSDELDIMRLEEYEANKHVLEPEDYFEGF